MADKPNPFADENEKLKEEAAKLKADKEKAEKSFADLASEVKKSMGALAGDKPDLKAALEPLAKSVDVELPSFPEFVVKAAPEPEVPEAFKAQWEAMQKSSAEDKARLEKLEKAAAVKTFITKAEADFGSVPGASHTEMGELLQKAHAGENCGEDLEKVLKAVNGFVAESELFKAKGSDLSNDGEGNTAFEKMEGQAKELMQKSAEAGKPLSKAQAIVEVSRLNPELRREASVQQ